MSQIELYVPRLEDLWFRRQMLADPATMGYNKGYALGFPAYHNDTGCIDFPESDWPGWYARWVNAQPERFYAYLRQQEAGAAGAFLGEVSLYQTTGPGVYEMGIVLHSAQRGKGYSAGGLRLLLAYAFGELAAGKVTNSFEPARAAALKLHRSVGFQVEKEEAGLLYLSLTAEGYRKATK